ncbi:MAG TPA: RNA methyltransferase [Acidimicrobiales bacterium]
MQKRSVRWDERAFVAEGAELLRSALRAGVPIESVYVAPGGADDALVAETLAQAEAAGVRVIPLASGVLERVSDTVTPQPVLTVLPMLDRGGAGGGAGGDGLSFEDAAEHPLIVVMVDVRDPGNAGTVLRTADASGVSTVVFAGDSVDPYNPKTVRASAGSIFHVPFGVQQDLAAVVSALSSAGYRTVATTVRSGLEYTAYDWSQPTALFLGNEASGLTEAEQALVGDAVAIPMEGQAESLNVGVACAVLCFEALRQRRAGVAGSGSDGI